LFGENVDVDEHGELINGDTLLLLFNADHATKIDFTLPVLENGERWQLVLDTARPQDEAQEAVAAPQYPLEPCSVALLRLLKPEVPPAPPVGTTAAPQAV
jgi:hypothetical protein